jgi:hypothetical protein
VMTVLASNPGVSGVPAHQAPALAASADCTWGPGSTAPQNHVSANQAWGHGGRRTQRKQESDVRDWAFSTLHSTQKQVNDQLQHVIMQQNRCTQLASQTQEGNGCVTASTQAESACQPDSACSTVMIKEECPPNQAVTLSDKEATSSISGSADLEALKRKAPDTCTELPLHRTQRPSPWQCNMSKNKNCHFCEHAPKRAAYFACLTPRCDQTFCETCLSRHLGIPTNFQGQKDADLAAWRCPICTWECCCMKDECTLKHLHCKRYRRRIKNARGGTK